MKCVKQAFDNFVYYFKEENGSKWKIIFKTPAKTCPHLNISPFNLCWKLSSLRQCAEMSKTEGESTQALLFQMDSCLCRSAGDCKFDGSFLSSVPHVEMVKQEPCL